jgi:hypothetical protein
MLELVIFLEVVKQRLGDKIQPKIRGDTYYVIAGGLVLIYTLGTALAGPTAVPVGAIYIVPVIVFALFSFFTIILIPLGIVLL